MQMILRWFPGGDDSVALWQIKQIPGVTGVATCLPDVPVGAVWPLERMRILRDEVHAAGLSLEVIESVNIHEDIKKGLPGRDRYIDNYIQTLRHLGDIGVQCLCYNFMPVLDWIRSDLSHILEDGSQVMSYRHEEVLRMKPQMMSDTMTSKAGGYSLPGWEPERLSGMQSDIEYYQSVSSEAYWRNMQYFLDAVVPWAERMDIRMAIHPDDPPWPLYGLPKVITNTDNIRTFLSLSESRYNGLTLCSGSLGSDPDNDIPAIAREFSSKKRIHYAHIRNIKRLGARDFDESAHLSACGDLNMFEIVRALYETGFDGYIRPDHGRMIWGEKARPGYGLYDRAIGAGYLLGLWEALARGGARE